MAKKAKKKIDINLMLKKGEFESALKALKDQLKLKPDDVEINIKIAEIYEKSGSPEIAIEYYEKLNKSEPDNPEHLFRLASAKKNAGHITESIEIFNQALDIKPDYLEALNLQGILFLEISQYENAEKNFLEIIKLKEDASGTHLNLAKVYTDTGKIKKAIYHLETSISYSSDSSLPYSNLSSVYLMACRQEDCLEACLRAIELDPGNLQARQNYAFNLHYSSEYGRDKIYAEHLNCVKIITPLKARQLLNLPIAKKRIRVGYVSSDLRRHSVGYFMKPIIAGHDRDKVLPYIYYNHKTTDNITEQFIDMQPYSWRDIHTLTREQAVDLIREDRIDILVDLSGHTSGNRIDLFAQKIAPVQITYLGYPDTTGLANMDYRITDAYADPRDIADKYCTEKLLRIEKSFLCYEPPEDLPDIEYRQEKASLSVTLGSFNASSKLSKKTIKIWSQLLCANSSFTLMLKSLAFRDKDIAGDVKSLFEEQGVLREQIEVIGFTDGLKEHLELYNQVDIALDPFPYNGTTTTFEALAMGCPVVVLEGDRHSSRVGLSILSNLGLDEFIAKNEQQYVDIVLDLTSNIEKTREYKNKIRKKLFNSILTDQKSFVAKLEEQYRNVWVKWCDGKEITHGLINLDQAIQLRVPADALRKDIQALLKEDSSYAVIKDIIKHIPLRGKTAIDIRANFGQRSLLFSQFAEKVIAFEPSSDLVSFLKWNVVENKCGNIEVVEAGVGRDRQAIMIPYEITLNLAVPTNEREHYELTTLISLDEEEKAFEYGEVGLVYLSSAEGRQDDIIQGAVDVLEKNSPLVIVQNDFDNESQRRQVFLSLTKVGYTPYSILPHLNCLVPTGVETLTEHTFFCCEDMISVLAQKDLLVREATEEEFYIEECADWTGYWTQTQYYQVFKDLWNENWEQGDKSDYLKVLELYILSRDTDKRIVERYRLLSKSFTNLKKICETAPSFSRLLSLARISRDMGEKAYSLGVLNLLNDLFESPEQLQINEPFLAVNERFDRIDPEDNIGQWLFGGVLDSIISLELTNLDVSRSKQLIEKINLIEDFGYRSSYLTIERFFLMINIGCMPTEIPLELLEKSYQTLNHRWWQGLEKKIS